MGLGNATNEKCITKILLGKCSTGQASAGALTSSSADAAVDEKTLAALNLGRIQPERLAGEIATCGSAGYLVLDLRSFLNYNQSHVRDAVNVCVLAPKLKKGFSLSIVEGSICKQQDKDKFRDRKGITMILYDSSEDSSMRNKVLVHLFSSLKEEGQVAGAYWLSGGFDAFEKSYPDLCKQYSGSVNRLFMCAPSIAHDSGAKTVNAANNSGPDEPVEILNFLYLAGEKVAGSRQVLSKFNIKNIVNCAIECPNSFSSADFSYLRLDLHDSCRQLCLASTLEKTFQFIDAARDANQNILVHCRAGQSRSATVVIAYLMRTLNWDLSRAYSYVQRRRPAVSPNLGFMGQLQTYEQYLRTQNGMASLSLEPSPLKLVKSATAPSSFPNSTSPGSRSMPNLSSSMPMVDFIQPVDVDEPSSPSSSISSNPSPPLSMHGSAAALFGNSSSSSSLYGKGIDSAFLSQQDLASKSASMSFPSQVNFFSMTTEDLPESIMSTARKHEVYSASPFAFPQIRS